MVDNYNGKLPGLNELRALAAICVIPGHINQLLALNNIQQIIPFPIPGKLGVVLFFVLSGYLITTLLLRERKIEHSVNIKNFYWKRSFRILPLYYIILTISTFIYFYVPALWIPSPDHFSEINYLFLSAPYLLIILPNYASYPLPYFSQSWSIGIEEQFYVIQPFIIKYLKRTVFLLTFLFFVIFLKEFLTFVLNHHNNYFLEISQRYAVYFSCVAIGSLTALLTFIKSGKYINFLYSKFMQFAAILLFVIFLIVIYMFNGEQVVDFRLHALLFSVFILNASKNPKSFYNLNNRALDYIGTISYGIYMYHPLCIALSIYFATAFFVKSDTFAINFTVWSFSFFLTLITAILSYKVIEFKLLSFSRRNNSFS